MLNYRPGGWHVNPIDPKYTDIHQTLSFSRWKLGRKFLLMGILFLLFGIGITLFDDHNKMRYYVGYLLFGIGLFVVIYEIHQATHAKPMLVISPDGVLFRIDMVKEFLIPWHQVKALRLIEVVDASGASKWPFKQKFQSVNAVVVTNDFYDRHMHVSNPFLRGPGYSNLFVPDEKNNMIQLALHHEILPVTSEELRVALKSRWEAFRETTRPKPKAKTARAPTNVVPAKR
jgi:hypothetical protein